jgi:hypothetical protein
MIKRCSEAVIPGIAASICSANALNDPTVAGGDATYAVGFVGRCRTGQMWISSLAEIVTALLKPQVCVFKYVFLKSIL